MARQEFYPTTWGVKILSSGAWAAVAGLLIVLGIVWVLMGLFKTGGRDVFSGLTWLLVGSVNLAQWYRLRRPAVIVDDDAVFWRTGLGMRRHDLADLALSPDPFDVTVLRLQTRSGKFLRLPRDGVARAAELERLLHARIGGGVPAYPMTVLPSAPAGATGSSDPADS